MKSLSALLCELNYLHERLSLKGGPVEPMIKRMQTGAVNAGSFKHRLPPCHFWIGTWMEGADWTNSAETVTGQSPREVLEKLTAVGRNMLDQVSA